MTDLDPILPLWQELRAAGTEYVLATVVAVEGSGYRKPGARMLIAADGLRAGTISGGCLEGEVARKALWHTERGPVVRRFSTLAEDGEVPFGMGCGGVVHLLLERSQTAEAALERLAAHFAGRTPMAMATVLEGERAGTRAFWPAPARLESNRDLGEPLEALARCAFEEERSFLSAVASGDGQLAEVRVEYSPARPGLFVFGAGDDAIPLVRQARQLGWYVAVADGRSHLATAARFPEAHEVRVLLPGQFPALGLRPTDAAAILTHSLEQDTRILRELLPQELAYIGILGPRRRTCDMVASLARELEKPTTGDDEPMEARAEAWMDRWMDRLHAPMGLDLGGDTPAEVALAVLAEIQFNRHRTSGLPLRTVRAASIGTIARHGVTA